MGSNGEYVNGTSELGLDVASTDSAGAHGGKVLSGRQQAEVNRGWFTPFRLLCVFCGVNMLNYVDRGAVASNGVNGLRGNSTCLPSEACYAGSGIQGAFNLTNFEDGILPAAFMVGLLLACPVFAQLAKTWHPFRLIGAGLTVWTVAVAGCGFAPSYWVLTFCRMLVGVGEASWISLASPFIDDNAPPNKKSSWLAAFYMCIPVGVAAGYVFGGVVASAWSWRAAFWLEALAMLPFCIFGFVATPVALKGSQDIDTSEQPHGFNKATKVFLRDSRELSLNAVYRMNVLGLTFYTFVLGCLAYWGPKAAAIVFELESADEVFGGLTVSMGILGTVTGGLLLDALGSSLPHAFALNAGSIALGAIFCLGAFHAPSKFLFIALLIIGEFFLFISQSPANAITLWSVPSKARPFACAMVTVLIHLFGDVPSPPLLGLLQDYLAARLGSEQLAWRISLSVLTLVLFLTVIFWGRGACLARGARDYRQEDPEDSSGTEATSPLLREEDKRSDGARSSKCAE